MKTSSRLLLLCVGFALVHSPAVFAQKTPIEADAQLVDEMDEYATVPISDPFEAVNRVVFKFNNGLYDYVLRPVAKGYTFVVPGPVRSGVGNFFHNLRFPVRFVNSAFQGKFKRAGLESGKFVVNTVVGVGGIFRVSDQFPALANIPREDTGQTLGVWRIGKGPYLVLPVFGPGTARDTVGMVGDYFLNPLNWNPKENLEWYTWRVDTAVTTTNVLNTLPGVLANYDASRKDAIDPYLAVRSSYVQYREAAVKQ
jgi:phospholipid-binding lipoprotein MlaA